jgi:hypothetical protein
MGSGEEAEGRARDRATTLEPKIEATVAIVIIERYFIGSASSSEP